MPIYAYRCQECGHQQDILQKINDPVLTTCPACQQEAFSKQITAAGFQLKGSGWYVTDFSGASSASTGNESTTNTQTATDQPSASCASNCACH